MKFLSLTNLNHRKTHLLWGVLLAVVMTLLYAPVHAAQHSSLEVAEPCVYCVSTSHDDAALVEQNPFNVFGAIRYQVTDNPNSSFDSFAVPAFRSRAPPLATI